MSLKPQASVKMFLIAIACLFLAAQVSCYRSFIPRIPNGNHVPNPDKGGTWLAVGHDEPEKGSHLNQFGEDFKHAGNRWTTSLCQRDSDGDGVTNGAELGDPNCTWKEGQTPSRVTDITHPGMSKSHRMLSGSGQTNTATAAPCGNSESGNQGSEHESHSHEHHSKEKEEKEKEEKEKEKEKEKEEKEKEEFIKDILKKILG